MFECIYAFSKTGWLTYMSKRRPPLKQALVGGALNERDVDDMVP
jgi:hypothetical protein